MKQHLRKGKLKPDDISSIRHSEVVTKHKAAREVAEQRRINDLGGKGKLENKVNPIGPKRQDLMDKF